MLLNAIAAAVIATSLSAVATASLDVLGNLMIQSIANGMLLLSARCRCSVHDHRRRPARRGQPRRLRPARPAGSRPGLDRGRARLSRTNPELLPTEEGHRSASSAWREPGEPDPSAEEGSRLLTSVLLPGGGGTRAQPSTAERRSGGQAEREGPRRPRRLLRRVLADVRTHRASSRTTNTVFAVGNAFRNGLDKGAIMTQVNATAVRSTHTRGAPASRGLHRLWLFTVGVAVALFALAMAASDAPAQTTDDLSFAPNVGHTDDDVRYVAQGAGYSFFFTDDKAVLSFAKDAGAGRGRSIFASSARTPMRRSRPVIGRLARSTICSVRTATRQTGCSRSSSKLVYHDLWPQIDMVFRGEDGTLQVRVPRRAGRGSE